MTNSNVIEAQQAFQLSEEQRWIAQAQQGDQQAFFKLYQHYNGKIYALCWRMLADKDSAEDVCQEVFVQLWQNIAKFRGDSKFSTWLHSVATNCVLSHVRKHKNWLQRMFSIEEKVVDIPVQDKVHSEDGNLDHYIVQLPERARIIFVLFAVEGYRHEEIAQQLNIAVGTSKAQYHRAKELLKAWLTS